MIHVSGTLGGKFSRRQTGTADWDEAKSVVALLQQSGAWAGQDKIEAPLTLPDANPDPQRISVIRAIAAYTAEFEEHTAPNTQRNYKFVLKQLRGSSDAKGYAAIDQWTPIDVREFRASWGVLPSTAAKNMSVVKAFFEFCHANEWTPRNPARMVRNQRGLRRMAQLLSPLFKQIIGNDAGGPVRPEHFYLQFDHRPARVLAQLLEGL
jgi:hypothetical protein